MKKVLVIMGTHPTSLRTFDWSRKDCDIWMFNEAPNAKNAIGRPVFPPVDANFQMHHEAIWKNPKNRVDNDHYDWLTSGNTPTVYMQKKYKDVPKSVKYPIDRVLSLVRNVRIVVNRKEKKFAYFTSSPEFALALVADMWKRGKRYMRVEVWGIELETESEYAYQRTGFGFWTGYLAGLGVELVLYNSIFDSPIYGYEGDVAISSEDVKKRIADLTAELGEDRDRYTREAGIFLASLQELLTKDVGTLIVKELNEITKQNERAGVLSGKIRESERYLEKAKAMEDASGASVFALGEFDGTRMAYRKQFIEVQLATTNLNAQLAVLLKALLAMKKGSKKRKAALNEFGTQVAEFMNKNMFIFQIVGAVEENLFYVNSVKSSIRKAEGGNK